MLLEFRQVHFAGKLLEGSGKCLLTHPLKDRQERPLPDYVQREFEDYLRCGRLEHGFLRVRCDTCHA